MSVAPKVAVSVFQASSPEQIAAARELFHEYADSLGFSLCFQSFETELATLPGKYAPPLGRLLIAYVGDQLAGCVAMRPLDVDSAACEMKRLYARPAFRGHGLGRALVLKLMEEAREVGYRMMRLDTVADRMREAVALYRTLGFREIPPYTSNPIASALYMEVMLTQAGREGRTKSTTRDDPV